MANCRTSGPASSGGNSSGDESASANSTASAADGIVRNNKAARQAMPVPFVMSASPSLSSSSPFKLRWPVRICASLISIVRK